MGFFQQNECLKITSFYKYSHSAWISIKSDYYTSSELRLVSALMTSWKLMPH